METAYFATGCFWGADRRYWQIPGVVETRVGYMGGERANPTYKQVCSGRTGHAEIVEVRFDPTEVSYGRLIEEFWMMHDPTSLNAQGNDIGTQYRSAIFTTTAVQAAIALATKNIYQAEINKVGYGEIVTQISSAENIIFWPAETYHQKYLLKNPNGYDCHSSTGVPFPKEANVR